MTEKSTEQKYTRKHRETQILLCK